MQDHERMNRDLIRPSQPYHFITGATQATLGLQCAATSNNGSRYVDTGRVETIHVMRKLFSVYIAIYTSQLAEQLALYPTFIVMLILRPRFK